MSEIRPKSPEEIEAQMASFATEQAKQYADRKHVLNNLENISADGLKDVSRVTEDTEYQSGSGIGLMRIPEGTRVKVARAKDYVDYLRRVKGQKYDGISVRAEILKNYEEFAPAIEQLRKELIDSDDWKNHPAFLGSGSNASVFSIVHGGKRYAVRIPKGQSVKADVIDSHVAGAVLGKGIPHLEQIVATSYKDGVTVAEIMPGMEMGSITVEEIQNIINEQLRDFVDTLMKSNAQGIVIDPKPSNIFYDSKLGFGVVDYHSSKVASKNSADQYMGEVVGDGVTSLQNAGLYGKPYKSNMTVEEYATKLRFMKANLDVVKRYRQVVAEKLQGEDQTVALNRIDSTIMSSEEAVMNYSDPQWVAEQIAQNAEWQKQRENKKRNSGSGWGSV